MTLEQLRIFVAVAEREHMTQASYELGIAQSAVSATVAALEGQHGVLLFDRAGRGIRLTEAGRVLLSEAQAILLRVEQASLALADFGAVRRGRLAIQASETIAGYWLPRHLVAFRAAHPGVDLLLGAGNSTEAIEAVCDGRAEIGFVEGPVTSDPRLTATPVAQDQMVLVVAPDHPWASRTTLTISELEAGAWVMRELGSGTRQVLEMDLATCGVAPSKLNVALELPRNEAVLSAVQAGLGATGVSANAAVAGLEAGLLVKAPFDLPVRSFAVISRNHFRLSRVAQAFLAMVGTPRQRDGMAMPDHSLAVD